ncbi:MAG: hypothetical protein M1823_000584 [Watsoniomyces obsoletus]|nr:MAG: hypothetical protein M1823_000584 [Watsoniomyces obsoletus]
MPSKEKRTLSHREIWDDSALIQSWDDALAEYKLYHSIHAGHARMEDVVSNSLEAEQIIDDGTRPNPTVGSRDGGKPHDEQLQEVENGEGEQSANGTSLHQPDQHQASAKYVPSMDNGLPQQLVGQVQDEGLKNLMMSWYYAGYYTGLYEGQQQAKREQGAVPRT